MRSGVMSLLVAAFMATGVLWAGSDQGRAGEKGASTEISQKVLDSFLTAFGKVDVDALAAHYTPDAVIVTPGSVIRGHKNIRPMFVGLAAEFGQPGVKFKLLKTNVHGDIALIVWKAETGKNLYEMGTDTYIIRGGKIIAQTVAVKAIPK